MEKAPWHARGFWSGQKTDQKSLQEEGRYLAGVPFVVAPPHVQVT
jgi:hypothetical protein